MIEVLMLIQTIAVVAILGIFIAILVILKKEVSAMRVEIEALKKEIVPFIDKTREVLDNINTLTATVAKGAESATSVVNKVKHMADYAENIVGVFRSSLTTTRGKFSVLKAGLHAGLAMLASHYLKKGGCEDEQ